MTGPPPTPPGWYYAQGDPPGTQRYWDGGAWQGGPIPMPLGPSGPFPVRPSLPGRPADYGRRVLAVLIDAAIGTGVIIVGLILVAVFAAISDVLAVLMLLVTVGASIGYWVWNYVIRQGSTGQTLGKQHQQIRLLSDATGRPPGAGMALLRYIVASVLSGVSCGVAGVLDYLWPLWDADGKRLTDKIISCSVIDARA